MNALNFFFSYVFLALYRISKKRPFLDKSLQLSAYNIHARNSARSTDKLNSFFSRCSLEILDTTDLNELKRLNSFMGFVLENYDISKSQIYQDLFVLWLLQKKTSIYFVEFGAVDGLSLSNSLLLENQFQGKGIIAEPNPIFANILPKNRSCIIDLRCVHTKSKETISFTNVTNAPELSTITTYKNTDSHVRSGNIVAVETVSLLDLLREHKAPKEIDYISIDTEGSEYDILKSFDFSEFKFKVLTVEHNFDKDRISILSGLLEKNGYVRMFPRVSAFDLWFVRKNLIN